MAINKITPRALDKATDYKLVPATAFIDAVNVVFGEDESNDGDSGGDAGVIKNLRGNRALSYHSSKDVIAPGDFKIIGSTTDHKLKLVYFFVYHEDVNEQGVWVYDPYGNFALPSYYAITNLQKDFLPLGDFEGVDPYQKQTIKCVVKGSFFNFKQNSNVQGNIVYGNTLNVPENIADVIKGDASGSIYSITSSDRSVFEKDIHLFFTDNINEPKKICVNACLFARAIKYEGEDIPGVNAELLGLDLNENGVIDFDDGIIIGRVAAQIIDAAAGLLSLDNVSTWVTDPVTGINYFIEDLSVFDIGNVAGEVGPDGTISVNDLTTTLLNFQAPNGEIYPNITVRAPLSGVSIQPRFKSYEGGHFEIPANNAPKSEIIKFCHACTPTPLTKPNFSFIEDQSSGVNNFEKSAGFKFAYQIVYLDGSESAISPKSNVAVPPSVLYQGNNTNPNHLLFNVCQIEIQDPLITSLWTSIKKVKILAQEGDEVFKIIKEVYADDFSGQTSTIVYNFKNDVIGIPVSSIEENKFYNSTPQKAEAQSVVDNRLMYGNYVEGLPNQNIEATLSVQYADRSIEGFGSNVEFESSIIKDNDAAQLENLQEDLSIVGGVLNKMSGFRITIPDDQFPALSLNDKLLLKVSFNPNTNYHIYNAHFSYHQSRHVGVKNSVGDYKAAGAAQIAPYSSDSSGTYVSLDDETYANSFNVVSPLNDGVAEVSWKTVDSIGDLPGTEGMTLGSSAAHPLIIPGNTIRFEIELRCKQEGNADTLRSDFFTILDRTLGGYDNFDDSDSAHFVVSYVKRYSEFSWDHPIQNFQSTTEGSSLSKMICLLGRTMPDSRRKPGGAVILKKGTAKFGLKKSNPGESEDLSFDDDFDLNRSREYKIYLDSIPNEGLEIWTCLRKWQPGSPWWFVRPSFMQSVLNGDASLESFYSSSEFVLPGRALSNKRPDGVIITPQPMTIEDGTILDSTWYQSNSILDFNYSPGSYFLGQEGANVEALPNVLGDWEHIFYSLKTVVGFVSNTNGVGEPDDFELGDLLGDLSGNTFSAKYFVAAPYTSDGQEHGGGSGLYSVMDGEGGPGGALPDDTLPAGFEYPSYTDEVNPIYAGLNFASSAYGNGFLFGAGFGGFYGPYFTGKIFSTAVNLGPVLGQEAEVSHITAGLARLSLDYLSSNLLQFGARTVLPLLQGERHGLLDSGGGQPSEVVPLESIFSTPDDESWEGQKYLTLNFSLNNSQIEFLSAPILLNLNSTSFGEGYTGRSFKSNSDHDFGIVFYDDHGRRSFVNPLGSVFVAGYSNEERGQDLKGPAAVSINLTGDAPKWASKYQFVHGGNKSIDNFIQYTTNGAYTEISNIDPSELVENKGKIYVSLNLLQNSSISYAKEWGGRSESGSLSLYKFSEGDKLRIISYGGSETRSYPKNLTFEIIEVAYFDPNEDLDNNPLIEDTASNTNVANQLFGEFVVLKNNPDALGFTYSEVAQGGDFWKENVVFEIFSPKKPTGVSSQVYQEIGDVYDLVNLSNGRKGYSQSDVVIFEGDVYFRPIACNVNTYDTDYVDLLEVDLDLTTGASSVQSNFESIFLESRNASDLFQSRLNNYGRLNVVSSNARVIRREAGIIYSEKTNVDSGKFNYSSFNASIFPFKDLEERFGNINFMDEIGGNLFVIQQDRCTLVPVSSTILSNAVGQDQLIASNEILGKERVYSTKAGCDNNPESVVRINNTYYFAHKSLGKVFRFVDGQGIEDISDVNMGAYFRSKFKDTLSYSGLSSGSDVRVVGGYDPVKQEYLLTILRPKSLNSSNSDDDVIVYGCNDPDALNYDPQANFNDSSCIYDDGGVAVGGCAQLSLPGTLDTNKKYIADTLNIGAVFLGSVFDVSEKIQQTIEITNTGEGELIIGEVRVVNDLVGNFESAFPDTYQVDGSTKINIIMNCNTPVEIQTARVEIDLINSSGNGCATSMEIPIEYTVLEEPIADSLGVVTINFYIGGTLIDQQFADLRSGVWEVTIDQNRVIQAVSNSYSGNGPKALLEVEVLFDDTLGTTILPSDKITIEGQIINGIEGFNFLPL